MSQPATEILISIPQALQILETRAPQVFFLEIVSDDHEGMVRRQYRDSHPLPGFAQIRAEQIETGPLWNLLPDQQLQQILSGVGLSPEGSKHILLYDTIQLGREQGSSRFDTSARLYSVLYYFGFPHVSIILDPAVHPRFPEEIAARYPQILQRFTESHPLDAGALDRRSWIPKQRDFFVSYPRMVAMLAGRLGPYRLLDARSAEEYAGIATGYDYIPLAGKIPTAERVSNGDYQVSATESVSSVLRRLSDTLAGKGITQDDRIVWYCGTGWRASRMAALTLALGYSNVAIYDGGWNEWHRRHPEDGTG